MQSPQETQEKGLLDPHYIQRTNQLDKIKKDKQRATCHLCLVAVLCFCFMGIEFVGGLLSGSLAILTDAAHILCDFSGILISLISIRISTIKASKTATYGYHRAEVIGALGSVLLIWGLSVWLDYEAVMRILHPKKIDALIMIITAGVGLLLNLLMAKILHSGMTGGHHHHNCSHDHGHDHGHNHHHHDHEDDDSDEEHEHEKEAKKKQKKKKKSKKNKKDLGPRSLSETSGIYALDALEKEEMKQKLAASMPDPNVKFTPQIASINESIIGDLEEDLDLTEIHQIEDQQENFKLLGHNPHKHGQSQNHNGHHCNHGHHHHEHEEIKIQQNEEQSHKHCNHGHDHSHGHSHDHSHGHSHDHSDGHSHKPGKKKKGKSNVNIRATFIHVIGDIIQSIGVLIAAIIIMINQDWVIADPITTFICSILVFLTTIPILKDVLTVLMEGRPNDFNPKKLQKDILKVNGVVKVHDLHVWSVSVGKLAMTCHVVTNAENRQEVLIKVLRVCQVKHKILHSTVQIEGISSSLLKGHFLDCRSEIH